MKDQSDFYSQQNPRKIECVDAKLNDIDAIILGVFTLHI